MSYTHHGLNDNSVVFCGNNRLCEDPNFTYLNGKLSIPSIINPNGDLKIQPNIQGGVILFGDTDVDNSENGKMLYVYRKAPEGNDYMRFYFSSERTGFIHSSNKLTLQGQVDFTINSVTEDIIFKVGDNAGIKKFYFKDSDSTDVASIDSDGHVWFAGNVGIGTPPSSAISLDVADSNPIIRIGSTKNGEWTLDEKLGVLEFYGSDYSTPGIGVKAEIAMLSRNTYGANFDMVFNLADASGVLTEVMRLFQNGNIGIGAENPDEKLHIYNGNIRLETDSSDLSLLFTDNDDDNTLGFIFDKSEEKLSIVGGMNGDRTPSFLDDIMTFTRGFRVGIKNSNPSVELDVNGDTRLDGSLEVTGNIKPLHFGNITEDKISLFEDRLEGTGMYGFGVESNTLYQKSPSIHRWYIGVNADGGVSSKMNLTATGLGLGTSTPHDNLHIVDTSPSFILEESDANNSEKVWELTATGGMLKLLSQSDLYTATQTIFEIDRGGTTPTYIAFPNSKMGIGTNTLSGKLTVDQSSTSGSIPVITLDQADVDQHFIEFLGGTIYTGKNGQDEYLKVKIGGNTRYLRLFN